MTPEQTPISVAVPEVTITQVETMTAPPELQAQLEALISTHPEAIVQSLLALERDAYDQLIIAPDAIIIESLMNYTAVHSLFQRLGVAHLFPKRDFSRLQQPLEIEEEEKIEYDDYRVLIQRRLAEITNWVDGQFATVKFIPNDEFEQQLCKAFPDINPDDAHNAALYMANTLKLMDRSRSRKSYIPHVETVVEE